MTQFNPIIIGTSKIFIPKTLPYEYSPNTIPILTPTISSNSVIKYVEINHKIRGVLSTIEMITSKIETKRAKGVSENIISREGVEKCPIMPTI